MDSVIGGGPQMYQSVFLEIYFSRSFPDILPSKIKGRNTEFRKKFHVIIFLKGWWWVNEKIMFQELGLFQLFGEKCKDLLVSLLNSDLF